MKKKQMNALKRDAKEIRRKCYFMLDNAPQEMSNISTILEILYTVNKLIAILEKD